MLINAKWLVDITEHRTMEGKVYLCAIKDCVEPDRRLRHRLPDDLEVAVNALRMAIILRSRPAGTIVHSDRGGQFRSEVRDDAPQPPASSDRWVASRQQVTTPPWSRSSRCSRRTS